LLNEIGKEVDDFPPRREGFFRAIKRGIE